MGNNEFKLKKIGEGYYFLPTILSFIFMMISIVMLILVIKINVDNILYLLPIGIVCVLIFFGFIFSLIREVGIHNYLIDYGIVVNGVAVSAGTKIMGTIMVTEYFDKLSKHTYKYITTTKYVMNPVKLQQFIENYPEIRMIIDPRNPKKGIALIEEYCIKNQEEHMEDILPEPDFLAYLRKKFKK